MINFKNALANKYLPGIFLIVLIFVCYRIAFLKTWNLWQQNLQLKSKLANINNISYQPGYLKQKNSNLNNIVNSYKVDTVSYRNNAISKISILAEKENVKLNEVPAQDPLFQTNIFIIQKLSFEGDYFALTKFLNELQQTKDIGIIRSLTYRLTDINLVANKKLILDTYLEIAK
jgi:hypothetical protein